jgi:arginyl-tRNA synthetase
MPDPRIALAQRLSAAIEAAFGPDWAGADPLVRPASSPRHGDYQANAAMALGKAMGRRPREVAEAVATALELGDIGAAVEVAEQGFLNITLDDRWLAGQVDALAGDKRYGVRSASDPETVVVDYSSPNLAKELHVGHLRSTVIGDALVRVLEFVGHRVIRQNHVGDWGTQFGMLVEHLAEHGWSDEQTEHHIGDLNALYQEAQSRFQADTHFAARARRRVVELQAGDAATVAVWRALVAESERHFQAVYDRLGVRLTPNDVRGESFYNDQLPELASELEASGVAVVDDGALCVFPPGFAGRDGGGLPLIVRKSDGGFGYAATDLAALRYRLRELGAQRVVYVVDARQSQHLDMVFAVAAIAGWLVGDDRAEHVAFGTILGADGRPYRTRSGETPKLADLLDEAVARAGAVVAAKNPALISEQAAAVARAVGIGAVKYGDLSSDRVKDYVFDWDRMLSFEGNTAPYLQYACVRTRSILAKAGRAPVGPVVLVDPPERALALALLQFDAAVHAVGDALAPHRLCTYLFGLAQTFTAFFEACPVLRARSPELMESRLVLCQTTGNVLAAGLGLLGIDAVDQM